MSRYKYFALLLMMLFPLKCVYSQEFTMPSFIYDITSCDFDYDGSNDILVSCPYSDTITILFNDGIGNFTTYYYNRPSGFILCGLIDEDDFFDIITRDGYNLYCIKNLGNRLLSENIILLPITGTYEVTSINDLNEDSLNDLVYTHTSGEYWGIFKNNGNLDFTNESIQTGSSTTSPAVGLLNNDSLPDVVITYSALNRSSVYVNNGSFNLTEVILEESFLGDAFVMDLDNQGSEDFAFVNYYTNTIPLFKYNGDNQFELQVNYYAEGIYAISSFLAGDFNQDGYDDFAITRGDWGNDSDSLYIYLNDKNWSFNLNQTLYIGVLTWYKSCSSDLNGDSYPDIFMKGCNGNNILTLLWNDGFGNFSFENTVSVIGNQLINNEFSVYPNPFSNQIEIKIQARKSMNLQVIITNVLGQNVQLINLSNPDKNEELFYQWDGCDISGHACRPGIYFITVIFNAKKITKKIVKL